MKAIIRVLIVLTMVLGTVPVVFACEGVEGCDCAQAQAAEEGAETEGAEAAHNCTGDCENCPYAQAAEETEAAHDCTGDCGADCPHAQAADEAADDAEPAAQGCGGNCGNCAHAHEASEAEEAPAAE